MASFIYLYSKFTEEFLLLTAAGSFTLLAVYCYTWVVKKRRLGAARDQVPAGMVKIYLNQLINEAEFVRTQLFGLVGGAPPDPRQFAALFKASSSGHAEAETTDSSVTAAHSAVHSASIPSDLLERLKALEHQLSEKESMVVNINVEKTRLLEELENVKQDHRSVPVAPISGNQDDLVQKIKGLEERLEEYALFEDDLANLKRLQQENAQLKKRVEEVAIYEQKAKPAAAPAVEAAPIVEVQPSNILDRAKPTSLLDTAALEALLNGTSATPPTPMEEALSLELESSASEALEPPTPIQSARPASTSDEFEHLVDSVEGSLAKSVESPANVIPEIADVPVSTIPVTATSQTSVSAPDQASASVTPMQAAPSSVDDVPSSEKTDEELLKEFENLLNS